MTQEEKEEIINTITARLTTALVEPIKQINVKLGSIQNTLDVFQGDLGEDRKSLSQIAISSGATEQAVRELVANYQKTSTTIARKIDEKANETMDAAADKVAEKVEPAMTKAVNKLNLGIPLKVQKGWWATIKSFIKS